MIRFSLFLFGLLISTEVMALSDAQKTVATKISEATTVKWHCPDLETDKVLIGEIIQHYGIEHQSDEVREIMAKAALDAKKVQSEHGNKIWCDALMTLYGPQGSSSPGLVRKKRPR